MAIFIDEARQQRHAEPTTETNPHTPRTLSNTVSVIAQVLSPYLRIVWRLHLFDVLVETPPNVVRHPLSS